MNRSSSGLLLSRAIDGFIKFKVVEGLSDTTITSYKNHLERFLIHSDDIPLKEIGSPKIEGFLFWLRTEYVHSRITGNTDPLSSKTIYNIWVSLKSFFAWALRHEFIGKNPMDSVPRPRFTVKPIDPLSREEVERLLHECKLSNVVQTRNRRPFRMRRPTYRRDKALTVFLLDTGLRASEVCALRIGDVDIKTGEVTIRHGIDGGAKGEKGRTAYVGIGTRRTLWRYLIERNDEENEEAPLFATIRSGRLNRDSLRLLFRRLGEQAKIKKCHPHRFRHTFAINYLRSRGDVLTLQVLLGHTSLEMVKR